MHGRLSNIAGISPHIRYSLSLIPPDTENLGKNRFGLLISQKSFLPNQKPLVSSLGKAQKPIWFCPHLMNLGLED
jgi:hypothetical protein